MMVVNATEDSSDTRQAPQPAWAELVDKSNKMTRRGSRSSIEFFPGAFVFTYAGSSDLKTWTTGSTIRSSPWRRRFSEASYGSLSA